jgi:AcrR family transcriptional regulator
MPNRSTTLGRDREALLALAAMRLLAKQDWPKLTLGAIARSAGLSLRDAIDVASSKAGIPGLILRMLALETANRYSQDSTSGEPRDRLFDVTMTFFDVQEAYRESLKKLYGALLYDPGTLLALRGEILSFSGELLALAEADFGLSTRMQSVIFAGVLIRATIAWREDDDQLGKTMAQLDGDLRRMQRLLWPPKSGISPASATKTRTRDGRRGKGRVKPGAVSPPAGRRAGSRRG